MFEPILLLGRERFAIMDLRIRVKGGGYTSQIYAIRQAIAKSVVAYYQKCPCCFASRTRMHTRRYRQDAVQWTIARARTC